MIRRLAVAVARLVRGGGRQAARGRPSIPTGGPTPEASKKSVPVFNDKHLAAEWKDAKWMYDRARELFVPFLAGSSVPVTWRRPELKLPKDSELTEAVQVGYGPFEAYGFHALEGLQC